MKLPSGKEVEVLRLLAGGREFYGLELVKASPALTRGSIYVILGRMEDRGYISSREPEPDGTPGMPRRLYRINGLGVRALAAWDEASMIMSGAAIEGA